MRLFNVDTDEQEIVRINNAIGRIRLMFREGKYNHEIVYGRPSRWKEKSAARMLELYEARLKELKRV